METKQLPIESVQLKWNDEDWAVSGYASVFNSVDKVGDTVLPGAFLKSLEERELLTDELKLPACGRRLRKMTTACW